MPERIQLSRRKGWRMPPNTVKVDRTTGFGNPFRVGETLLLIAEGGPIEVVVRDRAHAVQMHKAWMHSPEHSAWLGVPRPPTDLSALRGRNIGCWCGLDQPCHGNTMLELANRPLCPECVQGKTGNCIGWTLDADDNEVACANGSTT